MFAGSGSSGGRGGEHPGEGGRTHRKTPKKKWRILLVTEFYAKIVLRRLRRGGRGGEGKRRSGEEGKGRQGPGRTK